MTMMNWKDLTNTICAHVDNTRGKKFYFEYSKQKNDSFSSGNKS